MVIYNFILLLAVCNIFFCDRRFLFFTISVLCFFCGFRANVLGYDYFVYKEYYDNILQDGNVFGYEPFFYFLVFFFKSLGVSYSVFLFIISALFHYSLYNLLLSINRRLLINAGVVLSAYVSAVYFWHSYTLVRQSISIAIFYFVLSSILNSSRNKWRCVNLFGIGFHISHIIPVLFQVARWVRFSVKGVSTLIGASFLFLLVALYYYPLIIGKFSQYSTGGVTGILPVCEFLFSLVIIYLIGGGDRGDFLIILIFSIVIAVCGAFISEVFIRFVEPFRIVTPIAFGYLFKLINKNSNDLAGVFLCTFIFYCFVRLNFFILGFGDYAIPYQNELFLNM